MTYLEACYVQNFGPGLQSCPLPSVQQRALDVTAGLAPALGQGTIPASAQPLASALEANGSGQHGSMCC